ncbi:MAG: hypothetical protein KKD39_07225, partial [Candidatus Altiarchaeota archaeon]|nr:hypothetical protein [Candidatus Altiarchaeota archaeon]
TTDTVACALFGWCGNTTSEEYRELKYEWSYDPWVDNIFTVDSDQCLVDRVRVEVTCTDKYLQKSTLRKDVFLNITNLNMYTSII